MWLHTRSRSPSPNRNTHTLPVRRQSRLLLFVTLVLGLSALGLPSVVAQTPATVAAVRVIHASPDSPAVDYRGSRDDLMVGGHRCKYEGFLCSSLYMHRFATHHDQASSRIPSCHPRKPSVPAFIW